MTEMRLQTLRFKGENAADFQARRDPRYYNTGSCVHPLSITGIEIIICDDISFSLVEWDHALEGNIMTVRRDVLGG